MALINNTTSVNGVDAPLFWKITAIRWDLMKYGRNVNLEISAYVSPMQCRADLDRNSRKLGIQEYMFPADDISAVSEEYMYMAIKTIPEFENAVDCLDWKDWDIDRWYLYINSLK